MKNDLRARSIGLCIILHVVTSFCIGHSSLLHCWLFQFGSAGFLGIGVSFGSSLGWFVWTAALCDTNDNGREIERGRGKRWIESGMLGQENVLAAKLGKVSAYR